jgi:hypothetical protein
VAYGQYPPQAWELRNKIRVLHEKQARWTRTRALRCLARRRSLRPLSDLRASDIQFLTSCHPRRCDGRSGRRRRDASNVVRRAAARRASEPRSSGNERSPIARRRRRRNYSALPSCAANYHLACDDRRQPPWVTSMPKIPLPALRGNMRGGPSCAGGATRRRWRHSLRSKTDSLRSMISGKRRPCDLALATRVQR